MDKDENKNFDPFLDKIVTEPYPSNSHKGSEESMLGRNDNSGKIDFLDNGELPVAKALAVEANEELVEVEVNAVSWEGIASDLSRSKGRYRESQHIDFDISSAETVEIESGYTYLIEDPNPANAFALFSKLMTPQQTGFYITRSHPRKTNREFELGAANYLWLTKMEGENNIKPTNLQAIRQIGERFLANHPRDIILIEGVDYLFSNNDSSDVMDLIRFFKDFGAEKDTIILISGSPSTLKKNESKILEREVDVII